MTHPDSHSTMARVVLQSVLRSRSRKEPHHFIAGDWTGAASKCVKFLNFAQVAKGWESKPQHFAFPEPELHQDYSLRITPYGAVPWSHFWKTHFYAERYHVDSTPALMKDASSGSSVADPDEFWPDPDPTFENVRIRIRFWIRIRILTLINFRPTSF
jgi:hypothetical protein